MQKTSNCIQIHSRFLPLIKIAIVFKADTCYLKFLLFISAHLNGNCISAYRNTTEPECIDFRINGGRINTWARGGLAHRGALWIPAARSLQPGQEPSFWQLGNAKQIREHVRVSQCTLHMLRPSHESDVGSCLFWQRKCYFEEFCCFFLIRLPGSPSVRPSVCSCLSPSPTAFPGSCGCVGTNVFRIMLGASCMYLPTNSPMNY